MSRTKLDKIFDNKYHDFDYSENQFSVDFHSEHFMEDGENQLDNLLVVKILNDIDFIITERFNDFKVIKNNKLKRVNKKDINKIYDFVKKTLIKKYTVINIWNYLAHYFDIDSTRFFDSLDDNHKSELTEYLMNNYDIFKDKKLNNMF